MRRSALAGFALLLVLSGLWLVSREHMLLPSFPQLEGMEAFGSHAKTSYNPALVAEFKREVAPYTERGIEVPDSIFEAGYTRFTPELMMDVLDEDPTCHVAAHGLGRVIYVHEQDLVSSLAICQNKCNEGCIHGALMGMFHATTSSADPSAAQLTPALEADIRDACANSALIRYTGVANCYHAIGHVLASLVDDDASAGVRLCDSVYGTVAARYFCATGVYMQRQLTLGAAPLVDGHIALCESSKYPAACYRFQLFGIFPATDGYSAANAYCGTLAGSQRLACFSGVGADWYMVVARAPFVLNALCGSGSDADKQMCLEGALELLNVYYPGISHAACRSYEVGSSTVCSEAAQHGNFDMTRDLTKYVP